MLYVFHSRAAADVLMLEDLTARLFAIVGRPLEARGIFTVEQLPAAIARLEAAVAADHAGRDDAPADGDDGREERLKLAQRAFPFLDLLRRSQRMGEPVTWGV